MNYYTLPQLTVGMSESFTTTITEEKMQGFYDITGDNSPIHMSDEAAAARGHKGRVVYGMLGASLFSTLAGVYLPGAYCLLHSADIKFAKPVYIGDVLTVTGTVHEINDTFGEITIKATITNQHNIKVMRGLIKAGVEHISE